MLNRTVLAALSCVLALGTAHAAPLLSNGDFETGSFSGWQVGITPDYAHGGRPYYVDAGGDGWVVAATAQTAFSIPAISHYSAFNGFDGGVVSAAGAPLYEADLRFWLRQSFHVGSRNDSARLSFDFRTAGAQWTSYASRGTPVEARSFLVSFMDQQGAELGVAYTYSMPFDNGGVRPVTHVDLNVSALLNGLDAAGDVTLLFQEIIPQYYTGGGGFALDNVNLDVSFNGRALGTTTASVPEPASLGLAALALIGAGLSRRRVRH